MKEKKHSFLTRTIALAIVASMVLTMPGMTAWAGPTSKSSNNTSSVSQNFANLPPGYKLQPEGKSPSQYPPLVGGNGASLSTLQQAGQDYQTIEAMMSAAARVVDVTPTQLIQNGMQGLQDISARVSHDVYGSDANTPDVVQPGSIAQNLVHTIYTSLDNSQGQDTVAVNFANGAPVVPAGVHLTDEGRRFLQDGTITLKNGPPELATSMSALDALETGAGGSTDPSNASPTIMGEHQKLIDQYKMAYISIKADWLGLQDLLNETKAQIDFQTQIINKDQEQINQLKNDITTYEPELGTASSESAAAMITSDQNKIVTLEYAIQQANKLLEGDPNGNSDFARDGLKKTAAKIQAKMDTLEQQRLQIKSQLDLFLADDTQGLYNIWHPFKDLDHPDQANYTDMTKMQAQYNNSIDLDQAAEIVHKRSTPPQSLQGIIASNKYALSLGGGAFITAAAGVTMVALGILTWPLWATVAGGVVLVGAGTAVGHYLDAQSAKANLTTQDYQKYVKTLTDAKSQAMENYLTTTANRHFDREFLLNSIKDGTTANFLKALHTADGLDAQGKARIATIKALLQQIENQAPGARDKLLGLAAQWEGQQFVNKFGGLNSKDLAGMIAQNESNRAQSYLNALVGPQNAKSFWAQLKNSGQPAWDQISQIANDYGVNNLLTYQYQQDANGNALKDMYGDPIPQLDSNGNRIPESDSVIRIIRQLAANGNADALAIARANGVPIFNQDTGALLSVQELNDILANKSYEGQAALSTHSYDNFVRGYHTTFDSAINGVPWNAAANGWKNAWDQYGASDGLTQVGEALWGGFQGGVGSAFNMALAPVSLGTGYVLEGIGSHMSPDSYVGTVFNEAGAAQIGNNLYMQALFHDNAVNEVEAAFGLTNSAHDDSMLIPKYDASGTATFSTDNPQLDQALTWQRQNFQSTNNQFLATGGDVLGGLNLKSGMGALAAEGWNQVLHGDTAGYGLVATGVGTYAAETAIDIAAFGGINSAIKTGIGALTTEGEAASFGLQATQWGLETALVRLPAAQFSLSIADGLSHAADAWTAYAKGDLTTAANDLGNASTQVVGTMVGAGLLAGVQQGWTAATQLNADAMGVDNITFGNQASAFVSQALIGGTVEAGKMLAQGGLVLAGGGAFGGLGAIGGAVTGMFGTEALAQNYQANAQEELNSQITEGIHPSDISITQPSVLERLSGAQAPSDSAIYNQTQLVAALKIVAQAQTAMTNTDAVAPLDESIATAADTLSTQIQVKDGSVFLGKTQLDKTNPVIQAAVALQQENNTSMVNLITNPIKSAANYISNTAQAIADRFTLPAQVYGVSPEGFAVEIPPTVDTHVTTPSNPGSTTAGSVIAQTAPETAPSIAQTGSQPTAANTGNTTLAQPAGQMTTPSTLVNGTPAATTVNPGTPAQSQTATTGTSGVTFAGLQVLGVNGTVSENTAAILSQTATQFGHVTEDALSSVIPGLHSTAEMSADELTGIERQTSLGAENISPAESINLGETAPVLHPISAEGTDVAESLPHASEGFDTQPTTLTGQTLDAIVESVTPGAETIRTWTGEFLAETPAIENPAPTAVPASVDESPALQASTAETASGDAFAQREMKLQQQLTEAGTDPAKRIAVLDKLMAHYDEMVRSRVILGDANKETAAALSSKIEDLQRQIIDAKRLIVRTQIDAVQASLGKLNSSASPDRTKLQELTLRQSQLKAQEAAYTHALDNSEASATGLKDARAAANQAQEQLYKAREEQVLSKSEVALKAQRDIVEGKDQKPEVIAQASREIRALEAQKQFDLVRARGADANSEEFRTAQRDAAYQHKLADLKLDPPSFLDRVLRMGDAAAASRAADAVDKELMYTRMLDNVVSDLPLSVREKSAWLRSLNETDPANKLVKLVYQDGKYRLELTDAGKKEAALQVDGVNTGKVDQARLDQLNEGLAKIEDKAGIKGLRRMQLPQILQAVSSPRTFIVEGTGGGKTKVITPSVAYLLKAVYGDSIGKVVVALPDTNLLGQAFREVEGVYSKLGMNALQLKAEDFNNPQRDMLAEIRAAHVVYTTRDTLKQLEMEYSAAANSKAVEVEAYKMLIDKGVVITDEAHQLRMVDLIRGDNSVALKIADPEMYQALLDVDGTMNDMKTMGGFDSYESFYKDLETRFIDKATGSFNIEFVREFAKTANLDSQDFVNKYVQDLLNPGSDAMSAKVAALRAYAEAISVAHLSENGYGLDKKAEPGQVLPMSLGRPNPDMRWSDTAMAGARQLVGARRLYEAGKWVTDDGSKADLGAVALLNSAQTNGSAVRVTDSSFMKRFMGIIELSGSPQGVVAREAISLGLVPPRDMADPMTRLQADGMNYIQASDARNVKDVQLMGQAIANDAGDRKVVVVGIESNDLDGFAYEKALRSSLGTDRVLLLQSGPDVTVYFPDDPQGLRTLQLKSDQLGEILVDPNVREQFLGKGSEDLKIALVLDQGGVTGSDIKIPFMNVEKTISALREISDTGGILSDQARNDAKINLDPATKALFNDDGSLKATQDQLDQRIAELSTSDALSHLLRGDPLSEEAANALKSNLQFLVDHGNSTAAEVAKLLQDVTPGDLQKIDALKELDLNKDMIPAARDLFRGTFEKYLKQGPKFISVFGDETVAKRLVQTVGRDRGLDVASFGYHDKAVIVVGDRTGEALAPLMSESQKLEGKNNLEGLYRGFVSDLTENMLTRFDRMMAQAQSLTERQAVESARKAFEKSVGRNDNILGGQLSKAYSSLQQEVVRLQDQFQKATDQFKSQFSTDNRELVDTMNQSRVKLEYKDSKPEFMLQMLQSGEKPVAFKELSIQQQQDLFRGKDGQLKGLLGMSFEDAVAKIGGALQRSDLDFEVGQPHRTEVSVAEAQIANAEAQLKEGPMVASDLLQVQQYANRAARSVGPSGILPPKVGLLTSLPASPTVIQSILNPNAAVPAASILNASTANPLQRTQASIGLFGRDFQQSWASSTGVFKPFKAFGYAVVSAAQSGSISDSQRVNSFFDAYATSPDLVDASMIQMMTQKYSGTAEPYLNSAKLESLAKQAPEAQRQNVIAHLNIARTFAQTTPLRPVEMGAGYTLVRNGQGAQAPVVLMISNLTQAATIKAFQVIKFAGAANVPVQIVLPKGVKADHPLFKAAQLEREAALQRGINVSHLITFPTEKPSTPLYPLASISAWFRQIFGASQNPTADIGQLMSLRDALTSKKAELSQFEKSPKTAASSLKIKQLKGEVTSQQNEYDAIAQQTMNSAPTLVEAAKLGLISLDTQMTAILSAAALAKNSQEFESTVSRFMASTDANRSNAIQKLFEGKLGAVYAAALRAHKQPQIIHLSKEQVPSAKTATLTQWTAEDEFRIKGEVAGALGNLQLEAGVPTLIVADGIPLDLVEGGVLLDGRLIMSPVAVLALETIKAEMEKAGIKDEKDPVSLKLCRDIETVIKLLEKEDALAAKAAIKTFKDSTPQHLQYRSPFTTKAQRLQAVGSLAYLGLPFIGGWLHLWHTAINTLMGIATTLPFFSQMRFGGNLKQNLIPQTPKPMFFSNTVRYGLIAGGVVLGLTLFHMPVTFVALGGLMAKTNAIISLVDMAAAAVQRIRQTKFATGALTPVPVASSLSSEKDQTPPTGRAPVAGVSTLKTIGGMLWQPARKLWKPGAVVVGAASIAGALDAPGVAYVGGIALLGGVIVFAVTHLVKGYLSNNPHTRKRLNELGSAVYNQA